jgi:TonB family protein
MRTLLLTGLMFMSTLVTAAGQDKLAAENLPKVSAQEMGARLLTTVVLAPPKKQMAKCSNAMVTLDVIVGPDGKVSVLKVLGGWEEFQESAIAAVKQWTYKPYLMNGTPAAVETTVMILYPSVGDAGSLFVPDGKGGSKGGSFSPMPKECWPKDAK